MPVMVGVLIGSLFGANMIIGLRKSGIKNIVMLTGDNSETAKYVADQIGIKDFRSNLLK